VALFYKHLIPFQASDPQPLLAFLAAATLILGIPAVFVTIPSVPLPLAVRKRVDIPTSKIVILLAVLAGAFLPNSVMRVVSDILLVLMLSNTYFVPGKFALLPLSSPPLTAYHPQRSSTSSHTCSSGLLRL
jgi:hypothetical protein